MAYDTNNIFARILRGELPCHKVYEDDDTFAFLDIMPRADGHTLVLPRSPAVNLIDATPAQLSSVILTVQRIARAAKSAFAADGVRIEQFNEAAGGQMVFHLHFHVLPRWTGVDLRPPGKMADPEVLKAHAETLRKALAA
ncbi:MAG: HIT family protein [Hyphomicrobiaceae bacterium]